MVDTSVLVNLNSKLKEMKSNYKSDNKNIDNKFDFKNYLSKEVKNSTSENNLNTSKNTNNINKNSVDNGDSGEIQVSNKELVSKISEKLEKLLKDEDSNVDSLDEDLNEVIILLLNLIEVNLKDLNTINPEEISNDKSELIEELSKLGFINNSDNEVFKEDTNLVLNPIEGNSTKDTKEVLNNINNLLAQVLDNANSNKLSEDLSINNIEVDLLKELKNLVNILPEKTVKEVEKNLSTDFSKEIFNTLILESKNDFNNKEVENNDNSALIDTDTNINKNDLNSALRDDFKESNFNDNTASKNKVDNKEEKVLMKILEDDGDKGFSKVLNYYDKLNKTNPFIEVIKEPVVINKDTINLDFIKNIKYMVKNSVEELNVKIYPKELGEMTIKLISQEGIMKAEIKATSKETYNLLNSNLNDIKKTLENQNIRIHEVNIGIYNEDTTFFSGKENSKEEFENQKISKINNISLDEEEIVEDLLNEGNVNLLA